LLPAGAVAGWGLHPLESAAFARRTPMADLGAATHTAGLDVSLQLVRMPAAQCVNCDLALYAFHANDL
ncbi:hypothetical protein, partial [Bradyrhizobium jicamae]|uniref:hypothetical protein n=1 Tax=Bradyrhizobium jicamae TaxID=280332 RepID=UPI001BA8DA99